MVDSPDPRATNNRLTIVTIFTMKKVYRFISQSYTLTHSLAISQSWDLCNVNLYTSLVGMYSILPDITEDWEQGFHLQEVICNDVN